MMSNRPVPLSWCRVCYAVEPQAVGGLMARAERGRAGIRIERVEPGDDRMRRDLAAGTPVVSYLGVREGFVRRIEAPLAHAAKARKVLPTLLDIDLPFAIEDCLYDFIGDRVTTAGKLQALAVGARRADIQRKVQDLAAAGIDPAVLDHEGLALWTQAAHEIPLPSGAPAVRAVVQLGPDAALAVGQGGHLLGAYALRGADVASHIGHVLRSLFAPGTAVEWVWTGSEAADEARRDAVAAAVARDWPGPSTCAREPALFRLRAVARRALCPGALPCNLRSGDLTHPLLRRREARRAALAAWATLAAGVALLAANMVWRGNLAQRERSLDLAFSALSSDLAGFPIVARGEHAIGQVRQAVDARREESAPIQALFCPSAAAHVSALLSAAAQADIRLSQVTVGPDRVTLVGNAGAWGGAEGLVQCLKAQGYTPRLDRRDAGNDGRIPFTLEGGGGAE